MHRESAGEDLPVRDTYKTSPAASYQITLRANDGHGPLDGGEDTHTVLVHIP